MAGYLNIKFAGFSSLQDLGRKAYMAYGISSNGALDTYSYLLGNELVGNHAPEASIEITAFDFMMSSTADVPVCITGAPAELTIDGEPVSAEQRVILPAGKMLAVKKIHAGLRVYIAVGGGIDAEVRLGSCSFDSVGRLGERLRNGHQLALKQPSLHYRQACGSPWTLDVCDGCDVEIFRDYLEKFYAATYTVSVDSNNVGVRLEGDPITGHQPTEVVSRGVAVGSIQIVPAGQPIILFKGRGGTAGYPIIGVVSTADLDLVAQLRPGDELHFHRISIEEAVQKYRAKYGSLKLSSFIK